MHKTSISQQCYPLSGMVLLEFDAFNCTVMEGENWACGKRDPETVGMGSY